MWVERVRMEVNDRRRVAEPESHAVAKDDADKGVRSRHTRGMKVRDCGEGWEGKEIRFGFLLYTKYKLILIVHLGTIVEI